MLVCIGQQRQETGALNGRRELALIVRLRSRDTARHNLARFRNVISQRIEILVINLFNTLCGKPAEPATSEISGHLYSLNSMLLGND